MDENRHAGQERPRYLKHLAIHVLVDTGLLVFENVAAKDAVDVVVALPKGRELRTAGIRIRTSSPGADGSWRFSEDIAKYAFEKTPFFYIFCCGRKTGGKLFSEPAFVVVPQAQLKKMTKTFREGNYHIEISDNQLGEDSRWANFINNFQQIKDSLEESSQIIS